MFIPIRVQARFTTVILAALVILATVAALIIFDPSDSDSLAQPNSGSYDEFDGFVSVITVSRSVAENDVGSVSSPVGFGGLTDRDGLLASIPCQTLKYRMEKIGSEDLVKAYAEQCVNASE